MDRVAQDRATAEAARTPPVRRQVGARASVDDAAMVLGTRIGAPPLGRAAGTRIRRRADRVEPPRPAAAPSRIRRGDALPAGLRAGVEQLSGVAMDDVRVHYDSAEPGRLQALAYAQGADIHVAPGEERHLPHEAWHVAQQAQGRVTPTRQLRGVSSVNDDEELEREASVMGDRAARLGERALDAPVAATLTAPAQDAPAQLVREDEFRASPPTFLATNVLSLTMLDGLKLRSADERLTPRYDALLSALGRLPRHWFKLVVDTTRDKPTQHAYILTPALEKYVAAYPEDEAFAGLAEAVAAVLPVEDEAAYVSSAYVDYKNIGVEEGRHDETIGHTEIVRSADDDSGDFNPDIVFTAAMNGCAFAVTPSADDRKFVAWHFQSTTANRQEAARFREERGPTDWFGEDEYDDNQHAGLFEVTNMLHRGEDGAWNVVSQQNETAAMNRSDVTIKNVTSRPLSLDEPARAAIIKRIYAALQVNKNRDIRRYAQNAAKYEPLLPRLAEKSALLAVKVKVFTLLEAEEAALVDGDTLPELLLNALAIRGRRDENVDQLRAATAALAVHFEDRYAAENRKWKINQDKAILGSLPLAIANLHDIPKYYARFDWLTTMIAEMTPPAEEV